MIKGFRVFSMDEGRVVFGRVWLFFFCVGGGTGTAAK